jgi:aryl-alcohol dehydrogenase-like predicted oxidoreductase
VTWLSRGPGVRLAAVPDPVTPVAPAALGRRAAARLDRPVSVLGYGMWGLADWSGGDRDEIEASLQLAVDHGVTFFDTASAYGAGSSEQLLGRLVRANPEQRVLVATKLPPADWEWPSRRGQSLAATFPPDHIRHYCERSLQNLGLDAIDLLQFHVWEDDWADDESWQHAVADLRAERLIGAVGVSVNRWEPWNVVRTLRTGLVDAVQVIYNVFDQSPEDELFPLCRELGAAVVARVPFDEGSLTGSLTLESRWDADDWRSGYFGPENLEPSVRRAEAVRALLPDGMPMAEAALRFVLSHPDVTTVIPGMRRREHVRANASAAAAGPLDADLLAALRTQRWDREPAPWAQ